MSSAAPNSYLLDIDVQIDKATGKLVEFRERGQAEMRVAAAGMEAPLTRMEQTAARTMTATTASVEKATASFRGLGPTITAASNAMTLMGVQSVPALGAITRGVASLASTGFTPLGIAIGVATTALSYFIGRSEQTTRAVETQQQAVDELVKSYGDLVRARFDPSIARSRETRAPAQPTPLSELRGKETELADMLSSEEDELARVLGQENWMAQANRVGVLRDALRELRLEISRLQEQTNARPVTVVPQDFTSWAGFRRGMRRDMFSTLQGGVPQLVPDQYGNVRPIGPEPIGDLGAPASGASIAAGQLGDMSGGTGFYRTRSIRGLLSPNIPIPEAEQPPEVQRSIDLRAEAEAEAYARALARDTETMRSFGERGAASITSALNNSILSGDFDSFFAQFQIGVTEAVISAFTYALVQRPLEGILGGLTQNIGAFTGVGSGTGGYGGDAGAAAGYADEVAHLGTAKSARMSPKAVTLLVGDGATVNIGQGGGRGSSPARRSR